MNGLLILIPVALGLGLMGLAAFFWALRNGQFSDPDGAANRILMDEEEPAPPASGHEKGPPETVNTNIQESE
ncbi:cbb3-type cytochrome oxidase assembly protein CcoS [Altererythrobacter endophyticus]|uniref:Cbb3-type cytochrome oxidase assembly protein CcoS n=1 Tax=Altericroceibacterium endophyticum TaxID=1808508 RepID=A0A6I4T5T9_9SPHN|nr:cbb3-type cytochrome oxidase assembly protein CcoS [Altericroceibacterium endophyticum]